MNPGELRAIEATAARDALLSLAAELEAEADVIGPRRAVGEVTRSALRRAANLARERAGGKPESAADSGPQSSDTRRPGTVLSDPGAADTCMEAGPG